MRGPVQEAVVPVALSGKARSGGLHRVAEVRFERLSPMTIPTPASERFSVDWEMPASPGHEG